MHSFSDANEILILSQFYYPDITAAAFRIKETAEILARKGYRLTVITAEPHKGATENAKFDDGNVRVFRVPILKYSGGGKLQYLLHYFSFMFNAIRCGISNRLKPKIVWASSPPLFTAIAGFVLARWTGATFTLDIRDIWPDSAVSAGQLSRKSWMFKIAKMVEYFLYRRAKFISCVAAPMARYIERSPAKKKPFVLYNGIPREYLQDNPIAREKILHLIDERKINIMYIGNMGRCQNLGMTLDAARILKERGITDVLFHLVGNGVERSYLSKRVAEEKLDNVRIYGPLPKENVLELMKLANALFLQLKDDEIMEKTIPSKLFDYMVAGKPILYGIKGEGAEILESTGCNLAFSPEEAESFVQAVIKLRNSYTSFAAEAKNNRILVQKNFVRDILVEHLESHFLKAISSKHSQ